MMRVRMSNGLSRAPQIRTLAEISRDFGPGYADITTRQQIQLRGFQIDEVPEIWKRLESVGLASLANRDGQHPQRHRLSSGWPDTPRAVRCLAHRPRVHRDVPAQQGRTRTFRESSTWRSPRATEHCTPSESQDRRVHARPQDDRRPGRPRLQRHGGWKDGIGRVSRSRRRSTCSSRPEEAATICGHITLIFRDHGSRSARNKARLAFLVEAWGVEKFRRELQRRVGTSAAHGR